MSIFDDDPRLAQMFDAWKDGFEAGAEGNLMTYTPYKEQDGGINKDAAGMWLRGYDEGCQYHDGLHNPYEVPDPLSSFWRVGRARRR